MPNPVITTRYGGEVANTLLVQTATGNELFEKGLIHIYVGVKDTIAIPPEEKGKSNICQLQGDVKHR